MKETVSIVLSIISDIMFLSSCVLLSIFLFVELPHSTSIIICSLLGGTLFSGFGLGLVAIFVKD